jgi:zinc protease
MASNGYFLLKLQTKNSQAKEAEVTALNTLKNFVNKTVSPQQLLFLISSLKMETNPLPPKI